MSASSPLCVVAGLASCAGDTILLASSHPAPGVSRLARCACVLNNGSATNSACSPDCWGGTLPVYLLSLGALMFATFMVRACVVVCERLRRCTCAS